MLRISFVRLSAKKLDVLAEQTIQLAEKNDNPDVADNLLSQNIFITPIC